MNLTKQRDQLLIDMNKEGVAEKAASEAQRKFDEALQALLDTNPDLKAKKDALDDANKTHAKAKAQANKTKDAISDELRKCFIDKLPEGLTQRDKKVISIPDEQAFFKNCLMLGGAQFLTIDHKAVQALTAHAKKKGNEWSLDHKALWLFGAEFSVEPQPWIEASKLKKMGVPEDTDPVESTLSPEIETAMVEAVSKSDAELANEPLSPDDDYSTSVPLEAIKF